VTTTMWPDGKRRILLPSAVVPRNLAWTEPLRPRLGALVAYSLGELSPPRARCDVDVRFELDVMVFALSCELEAESIVSEACSLAAFP
jgi:hypothetical protein